MEEERRSLMEESLEEVDVEEVELLRTAVGV